jgi:hypothetical protein
MHTCLLTYIHTYNHCNHYRAYVGTYKTVAKQLHYNGFTQNQAQIKYFLDVAKNGHYDVVPFLRRCRFIMCLFLMAKNIILMSENLFSVALER